jgi:hypothetical protein
VKQEGIFPAGLLDEFYARAGTKTRDAVLFTNGPWERTCEAASDARSSAAAGRGQARRKNPGFRGEAFASVILR